MTWDFVLELLLQIVMAFVATYSFSILFHVPQTEFVSCGITGALGWFVFFVAKLFVSVVTATFFAAMLATFISRMLSHSRKMPVTIFLIPGVIPLVPGAGLYYTVYEIIIQSESSRAVLKGMETLKLASVIAIGIIIVLSLPQKWFVKCNKICYTKGHL